MSRQASFAQLTLCVTLITTLAVVCSCAMYGCTHPNQYDTFVRISGRVVDVESSQGIDSVIVSIDDTTTYSTQNHTKPDGSFFLDVFPFDSGAIYARKAGYHTATTIIRDGSHDVDDLLISLIASKPPNGASNVSRHVSARSLRVAPLHR